MKQVKIACVVMIDEDKVVKFEDYLAEVTNLISYSILPDTDELYDKSATFRRLVKKYKEAKEERDKFINEHG